MCSSILAAPLKRPRARKIKSPLGPYATAAVAFEKGKDRQIEIVAITPLCVSYRLKGRSEEYHLPHETGFQKALSIAAGFNTGPRESRTNTRGEANIR